MSARLIHHTTRTTGTYFRVSLRFQHHTRLYMDIVFLSLPTRLTPVHFSRSLGDTRDH